MKLRAYCLWFLGVLALAAAIAAPGSRAYALDLGLTRMIHSTERAEWSGVGRLLLWGGGMCTAVLLNETMAVTAAHCVFDPESRRPAKPKELTFQAGWWMSTAAAIRPVRTYVVHPDYKYVDQPGYSSISADIAILVFEDPIPDATARSFELASKIAAGDSVALVSYGRTRQNIPTIQEPCEVLGVQDAVFVLDCGAVPGTSGAPVFIRRNGQADIAAIVSAIGWSPKGKITFAVSIERALPGALSALR